MKRLADDDSRRVASAAAESLAAYAEPQRVVEKAETPPREEKKRQTSERDEVEEVAPLQPAAAIRPKAIAITLGGAVWKQILLTAAGWTIAGLIGGYMSWINGGWALSVIIIGAIAGFATGLVLKRSALSIHWNQLLMIAAGWAISWFVGGAIGSAIGPAIANAVANAFYASIGWDLAFLLGNILAGAIAGAVGGAIGGISTGLVLWQAELSTHWKQIRWTTIGWTIGMAVGLGIISAIGVTTEGFADLPTLIRFALILSVCGAIGGVFMFSHQ